MATREAVAATPQAFVFTQDYPKTLAVFGIRRPFAALPNGYSGSCGRRVGSQARFLSCFTRTGKRYRTCHTKRRKERPVGSCLEFSLFQRSIENWRAA